MVGSDLARVREGEKKEEKREIVSKEEH